MLEDFLDGDTSFTCPQTAGEVQSTKDELNPFPPLSPICARVPQAVRLAGISRSRLYQLLKSGDIEHVKVGSSTLILVESLYKFIDIRRTHRGEWTSIPLSWAFSFVTKPGLAFLNARLWGRPSLMRGVWLRVG